VGRIERAPDWILKYKERIEKGAITVEDILEAENRIRAEPIKISSVTRAISAMGYPITGLRRGKKTETDVKEEKKEEPVKVGAETGRIERGPSWLQNYREGIEKKTITVDREKNDNGRGHSGSREQDKGGADKDGNGGESDKCNGLSTYGFAEREKGEARRKEGRGRKNRERTRLAAEIS